MEISVQRFLFGGGEVDGIPIEGFHCLTKKDEYEHNFQSFEDFKIACSEILDIFSWAVEENITVDALEFGNDNTQSFELPDDEILQKKYEEIMSEELTNE